MTPQPQIHKCGQCQEAFIDEAVYLDHVCGKTGYKPTDPKHLEATDPNFKEVSQAALKRGTRRTELETAGVEPEIAKVQAHFEGQGNDSKVAEKKALEHFDKLKQ